jgi:hypothetical protein
VEQSSTAIISRSNCCPSTLLIARATVCSALYTGTITNALYSTSSLRGTIGPVDPPGRGGSVLSDGWLLIRTLASDLLRHRRPRAATAARRTATHDHSRHHLNLSMDDLPNFRWTCKWELVRAVPPDPLAIPFNLVEVEGAIAPIRADRIRLVKFRRSAFLYRSA